MKFNPKPFDQNGFTLIEIMVVVTIIAVMTAVLLFNVSRDLDRLARLESRRFMAVVNEIRDESIIVGEAFVMMVDKKQRSYSFTGTKSGRQTSQDDGLFKTRLVEEGLKIDWDVFEEFEDDEGNVLEPKVWISPLGEITPFDMRFGGEKLDYHVFVNEENQLETRNEQAKIF